MKAKTNKPGSVTMRQAILEFEKEVRRFVDAESDPMLRDILHGKIDLSVSYIADSIEKKFNGGAVIKGSDGAPDPSRSTITADEVTRIVESVRNTLEKTKVIYVSKRDLQNDPANIPAQQTGFYRLDESAALAGLTALEAARLMLIREGKLLDRLRIPCTEIDAPPLARKLLTLEEMRTSGVEGTVHPLAEWLRRAREKEISYIPGLDYAVAQSTGVTPVAAVTTTAPTPDTDQGGTENAPMENRMTQGQAEAAKTSRAQRRRNRLYQEVELIPDWVTQTESRIATILHDKIGKGSCVKLVTPDSISWVDGQGGKQETQRTSFKKWLSRHFDRKTPTA